MEQQYSPEEYDKKLEHLVDTGVVSYDEAQRMLGEPPYDTVEVRPSTSEAPRKLGIPATEKVVTRPHRHRSGHGSQYGEEEGVGLPGGRPLYEQPFTPLSDEQVAINTRGLEKVRRALSDKKNNQ